MFGSTVLDVLFGLIFIYLELSIACSAAKEFIEVLMRARARFLERGLQRLLGEATQQKLYAHPLIDGLMASDEKKPSYIGAKLFATALLDVINVTPDTWGALMTQLNALPDGDLKTSLKALATRAGGEVAQFRREVEDWFDSAMERVTGWYKRRTQWVLFALGLLLAVFFNADTFRIANLFMRNDVWRAQVAASAEDYLKTAVAVPTQPSGTSTPQPPSPDPLQEVKVARAQVNKALKDVESLGLPFGWGDGPELTAVTTRALFDPSHSAVGPWILAWFVKVVGLLVTALAVTMGAPFWFDLLNKVSLVRTALRPGERSTKSDDDSDNS